MLIHFYHDLLINPNNPYFFCYEAY